MICPFCSHARTNVSNSRPRKKLASIWRRRHCPHCQRTFSTTESVSLQDNIVVEDKVTKAAEPYNRGILMLSIVDCFAHDLLKGRQAAWWLTETIELSLFKQVSSDAPQTPSEAIILDTTKIAANCYDVLKRYDQAAAIQYAARHNLL